MPKIYYPIFPGLGFNFRVKLNMGWTEYGFMSIHSYFTMNYELQKLALLLVMMLNEYFYFRRDIFEKIWAKQSQVNNIQDILA